MSRCLNPSVVPFPVPAHRTVHAVFPHTALRRAFRRAVFGFRTPLRTARTRHPNPSGEWKKTARGAVRVSRAVGVFGLGRAVKLPLQYSHAVETLIRVPRALSLSGSPARAFCFESVARSTGASLSPRC